MTDIPSPILPQRSATTEALRGSGFGLPKDLLEKARGRVALFALVIVFVGVIAIVISVPLWRALGVERQLFTRLVQVGMIALSAALYIVARHTRLSHTVVLNLGLAYEITICFVGSMGQIWLFYQMTEHIPITTVASLIIIAYPLIVPSQPTLTLVIAVVAALTKPLGLFILDLVGQVSLDIPTYVASFIFPGIAVALAVVGSRVVYGISVDVAKARQLGSYHLEDLLGRGGMGEVWRAKHRMLARPAAIKLIRPEVLGESDAGRQQVALERFEREAQATAAMRSPHTIELYDFGISDDGAFYYVMELLGGLDAETLIEKHGPVPQERAIHLLTQVCDSLGEAHAAGLIHRDIKPSNVYVCRYGRKDDFVKVLDFGLVKSRGESEMPDAKLTAQGVVHGTPAFMAPEQVLGDGQVDGRSDIYAVGCLGYWLLTGRLVFDSGVPVKMMMDHVNKQPVPPSQRSELEISQRLEEVILACLEKEPGRRPHTADALAELLQECVADASLWTAARAGQWWDKHAPT